MKHYGVPRSGSPTMLATIGQQWCAAPVNEDRIHRSANISKRFSGDSITPRRTLTEADIVNFACLSGDHFYAHMDKIAAAESILASGGPRLPDRRRGRAVRRCRRRAGYRQLWMENLRFIEPVKPGDTIQVRLTCKRKTVKRQRSADEKATGVVEWAVEIFNQHQQAVALYSILTGGVNRRFPA